MVTITKGDITELRIDAIVNAANGLLLPGGGVCGAIHRKAGPGLNTDCMSYMNNIRHLKPLVPGEVFMTSGHDLPARTVIHTVGPVWQGGTHNEREDLRSAYLSPLEEADKKGVETIAFPCISTGTYGFPKEVAVHIALGVVKTFLSSSPKNVKQVYLVCFDDQDYELYVNNKEKYQTI